jgi:hypothetical protein
MLWELHRFHQGANDASWYSRQKICAEMGWNLKTVARWRKWLIDKGWLVKVGERDNGHRFKTPMYKTAIGNPCTKHWNTENKQRRVANFGTWHRPKSWNTDAVQGLEQELDSEKQLDSCEEDSRKPSPNGANRRNCDPETKAGAGIVADPSEEKPNSESERLSVDENETAVLAVLPPSNALVLSRPPENLRHQRFKELICHVYKARWNMPCPWGPAEGMQLKKFLPENPEWDEVMFSRALTNYGHSHRVNSRREAFEVFAENA